MMYGKTVLITGNFSFPKENAAGKRVLGLGYIFEELGYKVVFVGCQSNRSTDEITDTRKKYENFISYNFNGNRSIKDICNVRGAFHEFQQIITEVGNQNVALIVLYGSPVFAFWIQKVISFGKKNHIPVVFDCVDWIEKSGFDSGMKNVIKYIDTNYMKRYLAGKCDGVIAISRYLYDYYKRRGCKTVLIPPVGKMETEILNTVERINEQKVKRDGVHFVYAGAITLGKNIDRAGLKDRIDLTTEIMGKLHKRGFNFIFDVFGIEKDQYTTAIPEHKAVIDELDSKVIFHGKTPNDIVCDYIRKADFTILNRVITKVTTAGFPSKVSESLLMGTPVITNATSNIAEYIKNGENGLIISFDVDKAADEVITFCRDTIQIHDMKRKCNMECCFDIHKFRNEMNQFIEVL